jgi:hypothetical protein
MPEWVTPTIEILGAILGAFWGVKIAVVRLEERLAFATRLTEANDSAIGDLRHRVTPLETDLERMKIDIGTQDTGLRGDVRDHDERLNEHTTRIALLERR